MEIEVSNKAFNLAKQWVTNMTGGEDGKSDETAESEARFEMRPARLGLGAKYVPHSQLTSAMNPVEKKLRAKIGISKQSNYASAERKSSGEPDKTQLQGKTDEDLEDGDISKASFFSKKEVSKPWKVQGEPLNGNKRRKKG